MFILTVRIKGCEAPTILRWETEEGAEAGMARVMCVPTTADGKPDTDSFGVKVTDGFGIIAYFKPDQISACFISDVAKDCEAQVRCNIIGQRAQADFQTRLQRDPGLMLRQTISGGRPS